MTKFEQIQLSTSAKLLAKKSNTDIFRNSYEEINTSGIHIEPKDILLLYSLIPPEAPETNQYSVAYGTVNTPIIEKVEITLEPNALGNVFKHDSLKNVISHDFGNGYQWVLKDANNDIIPFGLNQWTIDSYAGILNFYKGFPSGYTTPITFIGWRYCGPVGFDNFLVADGSVKLVDIYEPTVDMDIATKKYVDTVVGDVEDLTQKLTPPKPDTFENKDILLLTNSYTATRVIDSTSFNNVIYGNATIDLQVKPFYKEDTGLVDLYVNNVIQGTLDMSTLTSETVGYMKVSIEDSYKGIIGGEGFFNSVSLNIHLPTNRFVSSAFPYLDVYLKYRGETTYTSNHAIIGVDVPRTDTAINSIYTTSIVNPTYVSGVPALNAESTVNITFKMTTLNYYRQNTIGKYSIGKTEESIVALDSYASYYPISTQNISFSPTSEDNGEIFTLNIQSFTSTGDIFYEASKAFDLRIDTSNESSRILSGTGLYPASFGETFDSEVSLIDNNELQLYQNSYRFPTGDFSANASSLEANSTWLSGPNYNAIEEGSFRYAMFKLEIPQFCRGLYLNVDNPKNTGMDTYSKVYANLSTQVLVSGYTGWLNANKPYSGIGNPKNNGDACLVVSKSSESLRYITFGNKSVKGTIYIRLGIPIRNVSFSRISIDSKVE